MTAPLAFTPGEPAGIGPDLAVRLPELAPDLPLVVVSDPGLLRRRAAQRGQPLVIRTWQGEPEPAGPHALWCLPVPLAGQEEPGVLDAANAGHVLATLDSAIDGCLAGRFSGLVTGP
ncbi:MAG TPA: 4-hydroxythreonine-4-phosphate dehydrogenase, partial [Gammaproteobacteria bacterium]|nr:4-hydroxythreonine-4-phosphate dehydrogenase [Gammaproteobacteria bacterium]